MPKYYTGASLAMKNREEKKKKFEEMLAKARGNKYYFDPKTKTHIRGESHDNTTRNG